MEKRMLAFSPVALSVAAIAVVALVALSSLSPDSRTVYINGSDVLPSDSLQDWVSYARQVALVEIKTEEPLNTSDDPAVTGGYVGREVALDVVEVLWAVDGADRYTGEMSMNATGWMVGDNNERNPVAFYGSPRLEVGQRYIAPLAIVDGDWSLMSPHAVAHVADGVVSPSTESSTNAVSALSGLDSDAVADLLEETDPDPLALEYSDLPAYERSQKVMDLQAGDGKENADL